MVEAMSHGGGGSGRSKQKEGSCTSVSLGKYVRHALRKASGRPKRIKEKPRQPDEEQADGVSLELISSSSSSSSSARMHSVVRVVLSSGVVEVYPGVVLACTVIRKHPPGLCLAHPDVFRNPHGARVRPLEPLFPGQKFLLLPESTIEKLQRNIPEGSVGAFDEDDREEEDEDGDGSEEVTASSSDHSGGAASSEEERETAPAGDDGYSGGTGVCSAREYFVARERWAEDQFKRMVARGLAVEQSAEPAERKGKGIKKKKNKKKGKKRKDSAAAAHTGCRTFSRVAATPRRTWEPSLPAVEEKEEEEPPQSETRY